MRATSELRELIADELRRGSTREKIAKAAGCSRVQLWRLETGRTGAETRTGRRLIQALREPQLLEREIAEAVKACVGDDEARATLMLQMLQILGKLSAPADLRNIRPRRR